jgi:hypothetical protein
MYKFRSSNALKKFVFPFVCFPVHLMMMPSQMHGLHGTAYRHGTECWTAGLLNLHLQWPKRRFYSSICLERMANTTSTDGLQPRTETSTYKTKRESLSLHCTYVRLSFSAYKFWWDEFISREYFEQICPTNWQQTGIKLTQCFNSALITAIQKNTMMDRQCSSETNSHKRHRNRSAIKNKTINGQKPLKLGSRGRCYELHWQDEKWPWTFGNRKQRARN